MVLFTTREKLIELDNLLAAQGQTWKDFLSSERAPVSPPEIGGTLHRCPTCRGTDVSVGARAWFAANADSGLADAEVLQDTDWEGSTQYHCNACGEDCCPETELVK